MSNQAPATQTPTNNVAVVGFILSLVGVVLSLTVLGPLLGVFGGIMSIVAYRDKQHRSRGFAVAGIVLGGAAIVIGVLFILRSLMVASTMS
jgi:hypothetical protein